MGNASSCVAAINETHAIISGGFDHNPINDHSRKAFLLDVKAKKVSKLQGVPKQVFFFERLVGGVNARIWQNISNISCQKLFPVHKKYNNILKL